LQYCKLLCDNAKIGFNKRTITVTALTGAAAVQNFWRNNPWNMSTEYTKCLCGENPRIERYKNADCG